MTLLLIIGLILILLGIVFVIASFAGKGKIQVAAGGFIGPIPFGFFSSPGMFWLWLILFLALLVIWLIFFKLFRGV